MRRACLQSQQEVNVNRVVNASLSWEGRLGERKLECVVGSPGDNELPCVSFHSCRNNAGETGFRPKKGDPDGHEVTDQQCGLGNVPEKGTGLSIGCKIQLYRELQAKHVTGTPAHRVCF